MGKKKITKELVEEDEGKYSSEQNESLRKKFKKNITTNMVHDSRDDELNAITNEKSKPKISSVKEVITNTITNTTEEIVEEDEGKYSSHQNESLRENFKKNFKTKMVHDSSDDELSDKTNETSKPKISSIKITKKATTIEMASKIGLILNEIDLLIVEQKKKTGISKNQKSYTLMKTLLTDGIEYIEITEFTTSRLFIYRIGILF